MRSLWFKARYVAPILDGSKRDTIRAKRPRFEPGECVAASVGPMRPFALLKIEQIDEVPPTDLDTEALDAVRAVYPAATRLWRVQFRLEETRRSC